MFLRILSLFIVCLNCSCVEVLIVDDLFDASLAGDTNDDNYETLQSQSGSEQTVANSNDQDQMNDLSLDQTMTDMMITDMMITDMIPIDQGIEEVCNDEDDDLDGLVDENLLNACGQCPEAVTEELCDGLDNDCDQMVDEEAVCPCPSLIEQDSIYLFCENQIAWGAAFDFCAQQQFTLTSIQSQAENEVLFAQMQMYGFSDTWIGLNDLNQEGSFEWSDQSPMNYTRWGEGEPNDAGGNGEDCGIILMENRQSRWDDRACSRQYSYICERLIVQP